MSQNGFQGCHLWFNRIRTTVLLVYSFRLLPTLRMSMSCQQMPLRILLLSLMVCQFTFVSPVFAVNVDSYLMEGAKKSEAGDYRGALIEINKAIELDPTNAVAYQYRGVAKAKYGDFEGSILDYSKSIELDSTSAESYGSRGIAKARSGDVAGAVLDFDVAIQINPDDGTAIFNHGMAMEMSNNLQKACLDWNQAIKLGNQQSKTFYQKYCK